VKTLADGLAEVDGETLNENQAKKKAETQEEILA